MKTDDSLKDTLEKLVERAETDAVARELLSRLEDLDEVLKSAEASEDRIVLPYSSMPKISNRCWK